MPQSDAMPPSLEDLWNSAPPSRRAFDPAALAALAEPVRRYLTHAIASGAPLFSAVRLRMHGEIKIKRWYPFSAEEVICWNRGFIWRGAVRMPMLTIRGGDYFAGGRGAMRWRLFGLLPFITASGPDVTRSAAGRLNMESVWLPSVLCREGVSWSAFDDVRIRASFSAHGEAAKIDLAIAENGAATSLAMPRWGNPEREAFHEVPFGGFVEQEALFSGYTIPTRLRLGCTLVQTDSSPKGNSFEPLSMPRYSGDIPRAHEPRAHEQGTEISPDDPLRPRQQIALTAIRSENIKECFVDVFI